MFSSFLRGSLIYSNTLKEKREQIKNEDEKSFSLLPRDINLFQISYTIVIALQVWVQDVWRLIEKESVGNGWGNLNDFLWIESFLTVFLKDEVKF